MLDAAGELLRRSQLHERLRYDADTDLHAALCTGDLAKVIDGTHRDQLARDELRDVEIRDIEVALYLAVLDHESVMVETARVRFYLDLVVELALSAYSTTLRCVIGAYVYIEGAGAAKGDGCVDHETNWSMSMP